MSLRYVIWTLLIGCISCMDYTPKPRGYFRIDAPAAHYIPLPLDELPYTFHISTQVEVELPPVGDPAGWINLAYPVLNAKIYCSYLPITTTMLDELWEDSRLFISRQAVNSRTIQEQTYSDPEGKVYGSLFLLDGNSTAPVQFILTDSVSHFFRGSLFYDCIPNADSLAPVTNYLREDVVELIQSFHWNP